MAYKSTKAKAASDKQKRVQKTAKLGSGKRFAALADSLKAKGKSEKSSKAIAAAIGRKKYGNKKMSKMAADGKKK